MDGQLQIHVVLSLALIILSSSCFDLTILHTNDIHARFDEAHKYGGICTESLRASNSCVGGVSRRMTVVKQIRETQENVILLDGGDQFQGTFWFYVYQGQAAAYFMKLLQYDAMAIGNHEFDSGIDTLQAFITNVSSTFDVVSSNIDNRNEPRLQGYKSYTVLSVNGRKIGVVGYTTEETPILTSTDATGKLVFHNIYDSIRASVQDMKSQHPDVNIIVALGHAGFDVDRQIPMEVPEVDVVVGGHSNTFLYTGDAPAGEIPEDTYPHEVQKSNGKKALCVQAYYFSKYLGRLDVNFDDNGDIVSYDGNPILLDYTVEKDPDTEELLKPFRERVSAEGDVSIATTTVFLNSSCRYEECNFGNLVADAWIHTNTLYGEDLRWARASIALCNGGSIRAPITKGNITTASLLTSMPFGSTIVALEVSGRTLKEVFENSVGTYGDPSTNGRFLQVSGVKVSYDLNKEAGNRVANLDLLCLECSEPKYEPLDIEARYNFLTSSFMASGGDGYKMFEDAYREENLGLLDADMVAEYMRALDKVYPAVEGRITFLDLDDSINDSGHVIMASFALVVFSLVTSIVG